MTTEIFTKDVLKEIENENPNIFINFDLQFSKYNIIGHE